MSTSLAGATPQQSSTGLVSRTLVLIYGFLTYGVFHATFLYTIGFVHDVVVPTSLDRGLTESSMGTAIGINVGLALLFAVQHLIMARPWFKARWTKIIPAAAERSTFVLVTCLILGLMFLAWRPMPQVIWEVSWTPAVWLFHGVAALGWVTVLVSTFLINHFSLFGTSQVLDNFLQREPKSQAFSLRGAYRWVRHPLMLGFLMAFWSTPFMTLGHLMFAGLITAFVLVALVFEENDLLAAHGESYAEYRRTVPKLLPWPRPRG